MPVTQIAVVPVTTSSGAAAASGTAAGAGGAPGTSAATSEAQPPEEAGRSGESRHPSSAASHRQMKTRSASERPRSATSKTRIELRTLSSPATTNTTNHYPSTTATAAMPFVVCQSSSYLPGSVPDTPLSSAPFTRPSTAGSLSSHPFRHSTGSASRNKPKPSSLSSRPGSRHSHHPPPRQPVLPKRESLMSSLSLMSNNSDICRICHCEGEEEMPLIHPCLCLGSLQFVHQACIQQWIKSSNTKRCELCRFELIMQSKLKSLSKWERLDMTVGEKRKIICSVSFHLIAVTCVIWALYVLINETSNEVQSEGMQWPFWTKLVVVAVGFTGGLVFMYVQCKAYAHLWRRLKAYNRVIYVQNCPAEVRAKAKEQQKDVGEAPKPQMDIIN